MIAIINGRLVLEDRVLENGVLLLEGDTIAALGTAETVTVPADATVYDAKGQFVGPGLVDLHVHGGGGAMFADDPLTASAHFLRHGETTQLPTLYYDLEKTELLAAIARVRAAAAAPGGEAMAGLYMEGPYMNPVYGASPEKNRWKGPIAAEDYEALLAATGDFAKVWVVAPEREGILPFVQAVHAATPQAIISVGHSEATPAQVAALKPYGLRLLTHAMNATGRPAGTAGTRRCGPDEACFLDDDMTAEVICDSAGIHVEPPMLQLLLKIKGPERVVLISDSFVSAEPTPPAFAHITDLSFDANGGLSGSKLTLDVACRNFMRHTGRPIWEAFCLAARNPARMLGMDSTIGSLAVGKRANLVIVDNDFTVKDVFLHGVLQGG